MYVDGTCNGSLEGAWEWFVEEGSGPSEGGVVQFFSSQKGVDGRVGFDGS